MHQENVDMRCCLAVKFIVEKYAGEDRQSYALPVGSDVHTYGWGSQNNTNPLQASEVLKGLAMSTISCGDSIFAGTQGNAPKFFCTAGSLEFGAVCNSDEGGKSL